MASVQPTSAVHDGDIEKRDLSAKDVENSSSHVDSSVGHEAHGGVKTMEESHKMFGKYSKWLLFISIAAASYVYSLDATTTWQYLAFAASSLGNHSLIATIQVAQAIITACGKPVIAKVADVGSRGGAYVFVLIFYLVGYIVIASAKNVQTIAGGIVLYAVGSTGLQLLTSIVIADYTTLQWRGVVNGLASMPFVINAFVGPNISTSVLGGVGWRWGYGMFAIMVPIVLSPLISVLLYGEHKTKKLAGKTSDSTIPFQQRFLKTADKLDVVGLLLLGGAITLILLPLTLNRVAVGGWKNPSIIAMLVVGVVLLPVFFLWEVKFANYPVIPKRFLRNKSIVIAALIGSIDFISFYLNQVYLQSFVVVVKTWPLLHVNYFMNIQTISLCVFGLMGGILQRYLHRSKFVLISGLTLRLIGCGLMIHSRGANASDAEIVWSQLLQGWGGGFTVMAIQTNSQAAVPHADVAIVTAVILLVTEIGGAIGNAIAGAIWTSLMPEKLAQHLSALTPEQRAQLFSSLYAAAANPRGDPIREGVILAYDEVMKVLTIAATVFAVPPFILGFFMPNWYLGDQQNAVDNTNLAGEKVYNPDVDGEREEEREKA